MINRTLLENYLTELLLRPTIKDYCPNGLQIEGKSSIKSIITGVTACQKLIDQAVEKNADAILVHHGLFWKGDKQTITGIQKKRISKILLNNINLFAYHLPLDIHKNLGNNIQLGKLLNLSKFRELNTNTDINYGLIGELNNELTLVELENLISRKLNRKTLTIKANNKKIKSIGICTGAGQDFIQSASDANLDIFISGEVSERTTHLAIENGINYISAGHHATERYGIKALGEKLSTEFNLKHEFIDIDNPV